MKGWLRYYLFESFRFQMAKWIDSVKREKKKRKEVELFLTVRASVRISQFSPSYQLHPPSPETISHPFVNFRLTEWVFTQTVPVTNQAAILWSSSEWLTLGEHPSCTDCHELVVSTAASYSRVPEFESRLRDLLLIVMGAEPHIFSKSSFTAIFHSMLYNLYSVKILVKWPNNQFITQISLTLQKACFDFKGSRFRILASIKIIVRIYLLIY
jgi:hypothetical protein